jgi:VanZ family protein
VRASRIALWGPFLAALAVVFVLSSLTRVPGAEYVWDKLLHSLGYAAISTLALRAFHGGFEAPRLKPSFGAFLFMLLWFVSDEWHQSFVPGRDASALDVAADVVGFGIAMAFFAALRAGRVRLTL